MQSGNGQTAEKMLTNDHGVCIRTVDFSETSQVVTFFTRQTGKVTAIAKGSKRQKSFFGGPVDIFACGNVAFSGSGADKLATLVEFEPFAGIVNTSVLVGDIVVLNCCLLAAELVNLLTTDFDPHPGLFDGLLKFLSNVTGFNKLPAARSAVLAQLVLFQLCLLKEIGLSPVFDHCVNCKSPFSTKWPEVHFSNNARGLICRDCHGAFADKIRITTQVTQCFTGTGFLASSEDRTVSQVVDILVRYITDVLGHQPKMAKYILNS
jgi:DNA repair protein RecO (recombination protein O)